MAITYVGAASAASSSVNLPSFQAGDVAFVIALRSSSATAPTVPAGWVSMATNGTTYGAAVGYRYLQGSDTTIGTWTNAEYVGVAVYRGIHASLPWDNLTALTLQVNSASTTASISNLGAYSTSTALQLAIAATQDVSFSLSGTLENGSGTRFAVVDNSPQTQVGYVSFVGTTVLAYVSFGIRAPDSFPIIADQDTTSGTQTSNSSSWTLTYPTNIAAGDLLVGILAADGISGYVSSITDWVVAYLTDPLGDFTANAISYFKKLATGSETGTFNVTLAASEQGSWIIYRIPVGTWYGAIGTTFANGYSSGSVEAISSYSGSPSSTPDPIALGPINWDLENTLWLAAASVDTSRTVSAYPSSPDTFTNTGYLASGGSGGATLAWGRLEKSAQTVDPGTFTISSSDDWVATTIAIRPAARSLPPFRRIPIQMYR